jgi:hypothetical protein
MTNNILRINLRLLPATKDDLEIIQRCLGGVDSTNSIRIALHELAAQCVEMETAKAKLLKKSLTSSLVSAG